MTCLRILTSIITFSILSACMPATDPLIAGRSENAMMRFSAMEIAQPRKVAGQ